MSKWSRLKVALLTVAAGMVTFSYLGCLNFPSYKTILEYVAVGSILD